MPTDMMPHPERVNHKYHSNFWMLQKVVITVMLANLLRQTTKVKD
jgi:phosphoribosylformylglycinamidine (FGAM) synthase-like amidotransferase family enzyme